MSIKRRSIALAISTLLATAGTLFVAVSPANAAFDCRTSYISGGWDVTPCIETYLYAPPVGPGYRVAEGTATVLDYPTSCAGYRVYIVDERNAERFSTSLRPCGERISKPVTKWNGEFDGLRVKARFRAYNSAGTPILTLDSPLISSL